MKKQFLRVKQIADQTFLRAEKTEVLTEDLVNAEKRVDIIKQSFQAAHKKIGTCQIDFGSEGSAEKRMKKVPQVALASSMLENGYCFSKSSILGMILKDCASTQAKLGNELLEYFDEVEKSVLKPLSSVLEVEIHNITKLRKQLGKLTLDMDSARSRFLAAERHSNQAGSGTNINSTTKGDKVDTLKEELEEASQKVDQCRDALASEMFALIAKEPHLSEIFIQLQVLQANYHRNALATLEATLPILEKELSDFPQKPVYGCLLEEHLRVTNRQIASVIEICVYFLLEYGISEEGLLRIAGSASKLKKLKSAFDAGFDIDMSEYIRDPHAVSGALKSYLRELPEPLLTFSLYEEWMIAARVQDFDQRLQALWQVLHRLPESNFINLQYVLKFLSKLYENVDINKMSSQNIAIVMAPNLIWSPIEDTSLGMNMCTATLHNTIIETLISYADWFFPDVELFIVPKSGPTSCRNLKSNEASDTDADDGLITSGGHVETSSYSPKSVPKTAKKPAAPPPPIRKLPSFEKASAVADLVDISVSVATTSISTSSIESMPKFDQPATCPSLPPCPSPRSVIRRRSNENIASLNLLGNKGEKPNVPEKPSYSSYSLDRVLQRASFSCRHPGPEKNTEYVPRTQRPTVPPPDRPAKPSRFSTIENSCATNIEKSVQKFDLSERVGEESAKQICSYDESTTLESCTDNENANPFISTKQQSSPTAQSSIIKSSSKQSRFDFIVAQTTEKPPERPPRSVSIIPEHSDRTNFTPESNISSIKENEKLPSSPPSPKKEISVHADSSVVLKSPESERPKPPRPNPPPIPYTKPKFNLSENTNL